eukprot:10997327-Lingulodinium_polyedra.AAC.1
MREGAPPLRGGRGRRARRRVVGRSGVRRGGARDTAGAHGFSEPKGQIGGPGISEEARRGRRPRPRRIVEFFEFVERVRVRGR